MRNAFNPDNESWKKRSDKNKATKERLTVERAQRLAMQTALVEGMTEQVEALGAMPEIPKKPDRVLAEGDPESDLRRKSPIGDNELSSSRR
jgi:hypothetical protein